MGSRLDSWFPSLWIASICFWIFYWGLLEKILDRTFGFRTSAQALPNVPEKSLVERWLMPVVYALGFSAYVYRLHHDWTWIDSFRTLVSLIAMVLISILAWFTASILMAALRKIRG